MGRNAWEQRSNLKGGMDTKVGVLLCREGRWDHGGCWAGDGTAEVKKGRGAACKVERDLSINSNGTTSIEECGPKLYISVTLICRCWLCCSYCIFLGRRICLAFLVWRDLVLGLGVHLSLREVLSRVLAVLNLLTLTVRHNFAIIRKPEKQRGLCIHKKCIWSSKLPLLTRTPLTAHVFKKQFIAHCIDVSGYFGKQTWR